MSKIGVGRAWLLFGAAFAGCIEVGGLPEEELEAEDETREFQAPSFAAESLEPEPPPSCGVTIAPGSELLIRHLAVVEDPVRTRWTGSLTSASDGAWHFGKLMTQMAGANDPSTFVLTWMQQWLASRPVNGLVSSAHPKMQQFIDEWPKLGNGKLDLRRAPLRLLAIVNRFDLRSTGTAGEGRFVFGWLDSTGRALPFTIILEYRMPAATAAARTQWARDWHALRQLAPTSPEYLLALQNLTNRFAGAGVEPGRPNGSAISQVRSNETMLEPTWELREFHLNSLGQLRIAPLALTPWDSHHLSPLLARFVNSRATAIKNLTYTVPNVFEDVSFRGGEVDNRNRDLFFGDVRDFWTAPGITDNQARHVFSLNTCDGCHGRETSTQFLHVKFRAQGEVSELSGFLTGQAVTDPVTKQSRTFHDLERRAKDLRAYLCNHP